MRRSPKPINRIAKSASPRGGSPRSRDALSHDGGTRKQSQEQESDARGAVGEGEE